MPAADSPVVLHHTCAPLPDRVLELAGSVMPVNTDAQSVARDEILSGGRAHGVPGDLLDHGVSLYDGDGFPRVEAELRVQAERASVIRRLEQSDPREPSLASATHHVEHERSSDTGVLDLRVDGDRSHSGDLRTLVEEIGPQHHSVGLRHDRVEPGMRQQHAGQARCHLW